MSLKKELKKAKLSTSRFVNNKINPTLKEAKDDIKQESSKCVEKAKDFNEEKIKPQLEKLKMLFYKVFLNKNVDDDSLDCSQDTSKESYTQKSSTNLKCYDTGNNIMQLDSQEDAEGIYQIACTTAITVHCIKHDSLEWLSKSYITCDNYQDYIRFSDSIPDSIIEFTGECSTDES